MARLLAITLGLGLLAGAAGASEPQNGSLAETEPHDAGAAVEEPPTPAPAPEPPVSAPPPTEPPQTWGPREILGRAVPPGERVELQLRASESFAGDAVPIPIVVLRGPHPGMTLCLTAAVHGDELNGVEIVRRTLAGVDPANMAGTVIAVPIANVHGFRRNSRYLPDRRDLNRFFPGNLRGSSASRIAGALFEHVIRECDALVDFHTGSFHRSNIPQVRADLRNAAVAHLANGFGATVVVHSPGHRGTLRAAATGSGVPAITYEAGQPMRFEKAEIERGVSGLHRLLRFVGVVPEQQPLSGEQHFYYESHWVRVDDGGILLNEVSLGQLIAPGDLLGAITDPVTNERVEVHSPHRGRIIGMALPQVVIPGFAAFHIGVEGRHPTADLTGPNLLEPESDGTATAEDGLEPEEHPE